MCPYGSDWTGQELFQWLLRQSDERVQQLLAHCTAWAVNTVRRDGLSTEALERGRAAELDMRDYWQPTGEFRSRMPNTVITGAVLESEQDAAIPDVKKPELIAWAEPRLRERRWVPVLLRGADEARVAQ
jgi:ParB family chromosome partitioning protein